MDLERIHQLQTHQHHFEELNTKATVDARLLLEQEEKIMKLEKLNNTLETDNNHLALQTKYAEQKQSDAAGVVQYLDKQFKEMFRRNFSSTDFWSGI